MKNLKIFDFKDKIYKMYKQEKEYHIPNMRAKTILNIDIDEIIKNGIKYGFLDLDNMLFPFLRFKKCVVLKEFMQYFLDVIPSIIVTRSGFLMKENYINEQSFEKFKNNRIQRSMEYLGIKEAYLNVSKIGTKGFEKILEMKGLNKEEVAMFGNYFVDVYYPNKLGMYTVWIDREPNDLDKIEVNCKIYQKIK